jgi:putative endonuclease
MENALSDRASGSKSKGKTMAPGSVPYFVYILRCSDGTLYVGSTSDLTERERRHNEGRGAAYTAGRMPVRLVYSEAHESWPAARKREAQLKRWSRAKKEALIDGDGRRLHTLAERRG